MSRIDEALRRTGADADAQPAGKSQGVFVSAWSADGPRPPSRPSAQASPALDVVMDNTTLAQPARVAIGRAWRERLATSRDANPVLVEQFRRLAGTLHHAQTASGIKVIMMTSASPNDGKTLTAVNLALVLSESYRRRVLLIDADLRRPSLGNLADVTDAPGLTEVLRAPADQKVALLQITPTLMLLPAGRPIPDPMGALTSTRMRHIIEEAKARFDWVILDAPPMQPMADAGLLAQMVDGAVFVVRAGASQYAQVNRAVEALGRERVLGVVLNGLENMPNEQYDYAYDEPSSSTALETTGD